MKVKIFRESQYGGGDIGIDIEKEINEWLSKNKIKVVKILQSESVVQPSGSQTVENLTITIFYEQE